MVKYIISTLGVLLFFIPLYGYTQDSAYVSVDSTERKPVVYHSPGKAAIYSAAFPGLGQIYNRKFWKVPIVYVGFATLGYFIYFNGTHYVTYRNAYLDFTDKNPATTSYLRLVSPDIDPSTYDDVLYPESYNKENRDWIAEQLKNGMQYYKRYRDLTIIGIGGWYVFTILDAVVDAQLFDYDISPDLSMKVIPAARPSLGGVAAGITCSFTF